MVWFGRLINLGLKVKCLEVFKLMVVWINVVFSI